MCHSSYTVIDLLAFQTLQFANFSIIDQQFIWFNFCHSLVPHAGVSNIWRWYYASDCWFLPKLGLTFNNRSFFLSCCNLNQDWPTCVMLPVLMCHKTLKCLWASFVAVKTVIKSQWKMTLRYASWISILFGRWVYVVFV